MNQKEETVIRKFYAEVGLLLRETGFGAGPPESGVLPVGWQLEFDPRSLNLKCSYVSNKNRQ